MSTFHGMARGIVFLLGLSATALAAELEDAFDFVIVRCLTADAELQRQRSEIVERLRAAQAQSDWAQAAGFVDVREQREVWPDEPSYYQRVQRHQQLAMQRLTSLPLNVARGEIAKGEALSRLADLLGPVAFEHNLQLTRLIVLQGQGGLSPNEKLRLELLQRMDDAVLFSREALTKIRFATGLVGPKGVVSMQFVGPAGVAVEPLPLNWSGVFLQPQYQLHLRAIEQARASLLATPPPADKSEGELFTELKSAIDGLTAEFSVDYQARLQRTRMGIQGFQEETDSYLRAKRHVQHLRLAAQRWFQEGRQAAPHAVLTRQRPDGQISVVQLLACVHEQGWRFAEAPAAAENDYRMLCEGFRRYYIQLTSLQQNTDSIREEIVHVDQEIARHSRLLQNAMGSKVSIERSRAWAESAHTVGLGLQLLIVREQNRSPP